MATTQTPQQEPIDKKSEVETQQKQNHEEEDDAMPALETVQPAQPAELKQSRAERKARKAIGKLGLKPVPGIVRVSVKKQKSTIFTIARPDVYGSGECYVIFGDAQIADYKNDYSAMANAAKQMEQATAEEEKAPEAAPAAEEAPVDETGLKAEDIENVISQTKCTRAKAVEALKKTNGDVVQAILDLSA